jgi:GTP cyclohydrolase II
VESRIGWEYEARHNPNGAAFRRQELLLSWGVNDSRIMKKHTESRVLRQVAITRLPTKWGGFRAIGFQQAICNGSQGFETAVALVLGDVNGKVPLLRIHSQCLTGDALGSLRCDCGEQLELAMRAMAREQCGLLIYEHQEGRGIGLMAKLQAYGLQDTGLDTVEANHALGFQTDYRDFRLPIAILRHLGISQVRILSNNPQKSRLLIDAGIEVVERISCEAVPNPHSLAYLRAQREKMGHVLSLGKHESVTDQKNARADEAGPTTPLVAPVVRRNSVRRFFGAM